MRIKITYDVKEKTHYECGIDKKIPAREEVAYLKMSDHLFCEKDDRLGWWFIRTNDGYMKYYEHYGFTNKEDVVKVIENMIMYESEGERLYDLEGRCSALKVKVVKR